MARSKIQVIVAADASSLRRELAKADRSLNSFAGRTTRTLGNIAKAGAFVGVTAGIVGLTAALNAGSGVANVTAKQISALAQAQMNLTGMDDELIQSGENLLLTFKNVRNEVGRGNQIFTRATKSALDLSRAGFGSVETASKMLGKALNDPVRGMTALGRAGVTFSDDQKKAIKSLVATGQTLEAQKLILREVESQVGKSAEAYGRTLPGMLSILRENILNVSGDLIKSYAPAIRGSVAEATAWIQNTENQKRVLDTIRGVISTTTDVIRTMAGVLQTVVETTQEVTDKLGGMKNALKLLAGVVVATKLAGLITGLSGTATAAGVATGNVKSLRLALMKLGTIGLITVGIEVLLNRDSIQAKVNDFLRDNHLGFLTGGSVDDYNKLPGWAKKQIAGQLPSLGHQYDSIEGARRGSRSTGRGTAGRGSAGSRAAIGSTQSGTAGASAALMGGSFRWQGAAAELKQPWLPPNLGDGLGNNGTLSVGEINKAMAMREQASQFRALGLTSTGDALAPTRKALSGQASKVAAGLKGTLLDTDKNRNMIARVRRVLSGQFGLLTRETRLAMKGLLDSITEPLGGGKAGPLTKGHALNLGSITKGLGLSAADAKAIQFRLAGAHLTSANAGGRAGNTTINVFDKSGNPRQTAREVAKQQKRADARAATQIRGPFAGKRGI